MLRIAKNVFKTFEQSVQDISSDRFLDVYFRSIPANLLEQGNNTNAMLYGLRIVKVEEKQVQIKSFFDYIVGIDNKPIPTIANKHGSRYPDYDAIFTLLNVQCGKNIQFNIWSAKGGYYRDEYIHVSSKNTVEEVQLNSDNSVHISFEPLGFSVQWAPLIASTYTYHILNINSPHAPAGVAGLIPGDDYIVGCQEGLIATGGETILQDIVRSKANQYLLLYVYNAELDCLRPVKVYIGSEGKLGCGVGYGSIHRIPQPKYVENFFPQLNGPINTLSAAAEDNSQHFPISHPPASHKKRNKTITLTSTVQDYFQEGKDLSTDHSVLSHSSVLPDPSQPVKGSL